MLLPETISLPSSWVRRGLPWLLPFVLPLNPLLSLLRHWSDGWGYRLVFLSLLGALAFWGIVMGWVCSSWVWRELHVEGDRILLKPNHVLPRWLSWFNGSHRMTGFRDGYVEIPLSQASLEWVGRILYLHGQPEQNICLGRGQKAQQMATWLVERGVKAPVGA